MAWKIDERNIAILYHVIEEVVLVEFRLHQRVDVLSDWLIQSQRKPLHSHGYGSHHAEQHQYFVARRGAVIRRVN